MRCALMTVLALSAMGAAAQDDGSEFDETERCIFSSSIRRIEAIDDSTIAFFVGRNRVYVNLLPRRCRDLRRYNRITYETRGGQLCSLDRIAVIYSNVGLDTGIPCSLGVFHREDPETVEIMLEAQEQSGRTSPVRAEPVDLPPLEDEVSQDGDDSESAEFNE